MKLSTHELISNLSTKHTYTQCKPAIHTSIFNPLSIFLTIRVSDTARQHSFHVVRQQLRYETNTHCYNIYIQYYNTLAHHTSECVCEKGKSWCFIYVWTCQSDSTLPDGKHEQNQKVMVAMLIANTDHTAMQYGDAPYIGLLRYSCIIGSYGPYT